MACVWQINRFCFKKVAHTVSAYYNRGGDRDGFHPKRMFIVLTAWAVFEYSMVGLLWTLFQCRINWNIKFDLVAYRVFMLVWTFEPWVVFGLSRTLNRSCLTWMISNWDWFHLLVLFLKKRSKFLSVLIDHISHTHMHTTHTQTM